MPETGGILGVSLTAPHTVTAFHHDSTGITERSTYTPDVDSLNRVIAEWAEHGIEFIGFVHSHPKGGRKLSPPDVEYAREIMRACDMPEILMMIYLPDTQELCQYVLQL
ncbi:MAG: Mov34/MPN/PAD-1 family protein [Synergistaceae bacterium]|nr:Mov34/MPN/PAD-1 family protein [Synergistaceae bacterium]